MIEMLRLKTKPTIFCDMDGVTVNLMEGARRYLLTKGIQFYPNKVKDYNFTVGNFGCDRRYVYHAFGTGEAFAAAPYYSFDRNTLLQFISTFNVVAHTLVSNVWQYQIRCNQIRDLGFFGYPTMGWGKGFPAESLSLNECPNGCIIIEDNPFAIEGWLRHKNCREVILIDHPYNKGVEKEMKAKRVQLTRLKRVGSFQDGMVYLLNKYGRLS